MELKMSYHAGGDMNCPVCGHIFAYHLTLLTLGQHAAGVMSMNTFNIMFQGPNGVNTALVCPVCNGEIIFCWRLFPSSGNSPPSTPSPGTPSPSSGGGGGSGSGGGATWS